MPWHGHDVYRGKHLLISLPFSFCMRSRLCPSFWSVLESVSREFVAGYSRRRKKEAFRWLQDPSIPHGETHKSKECEDDYVMAKRMGFVLNFLRCCSRNDNQRKRQASTCLGDYGHSTGPCPCWDTLYRCVSKNASYLCLCKIDRSMVPSVLILVSNS